MSDSLSVVLDISIVIVKNQHAQYLVYSLKCVAGPLIDSVTVKSEDTTCTTVHACVASGLTHMCTSSLRYAIKTYFNILPAQPMIKCRGFMHAKICL